MKTSLQIVLISGMVVLAGTGVARESDETDLLLAVARQSCRDKNRVEDAVTACQQIIETPKVDWRKKRAAYGILIEAHSYREARQDAIDAAEAMRKAFPKDEEIERAAVMAQVDQYWAWKANTNPEPVVVVLKAYADRHPTNSEVQGAAWLRISQFQSRGGLLELAMTSANTALKADPDNLRFGSEVLWQMQSIAAKAKRTEDRAGFLIQALDPKYVQVLDDNAVTVRRESLAATLDELRRYEELRRYLEAWARLDGASLRGQRWAFSVAETWVAQDKIEQALAAYERVFTEHPSGTGYWPAAQEKIVKSLVTLGRLDEALKAARVAFEAAPDDGAADRAASLIVELLKQIDKGTARADAFTDMRRYGAAGRDRKPGTADDPVPVLSKIAYPDLSARRKAFAAAAASLGDGVDASLQRGRCAAYSGDVSAALAWFADAFRRCPAGKAGEMARVIMVNGFRPLHGNGDGLDEVAEFIALGPAGEDGKNKTSDDLPDPFAPLGLSGPSRQAGGRLALKPEEAAALIELTAELRELIVKSSTTSRQIAACRGYEKVCETLVTVDREETLVWIRKAMGAEPSEKVQAALCTLGLTVAKSDQLNLAGERAFMAAVVSDFEKAGKPVPAELASIQRNIESTMSRLVRKARR